MKLLFIDIETSPNIAHVWGLYKQNISISQLMDSSYVMCFSAKWLGSNKTFFYSIKRHGKSKMLLAAHRLLSQADVVCHYNGSKFDIPTLSKEFLLQKLPPPAPFQQIDLLRTARSQFRFPSNKLDYIAKALKIGEKVKHAGHDLWVRCLAKEEDAWKEMESYNIQDVVLLEKLYEVLKPWIKGHPNVQLYNEVLHTCPTCGSEDFQRRGFLYKRAGKYQRFQCNSCHTWFSSKRAHLTTTHN